MRISVQIRPDPADIRLLDGMADYARRAEASGFPGIWVGDSLGREQMGFDEVLLVFNFGVLEDIERARDFL